MKKESQPKSDVVKYVYKPITHKEVFIGSIFSTIGVLSVFGFMYCLAVLPQLAIKLLAKAFHFCFSGLL